MKKIDFETHFATQGWVDALYQNKGYPRFERDPETDSLRLCYHPAAREPYGDALVEKLLDLGEGRLDRMDAAGIDVAVISLTTPGVEQFERRPGDQAGPRGQRHPRRGDRQAPRPLPGVRRSADPGLGCRRQGAGAGRQGTRSQGLEDALQLR